MTSRDARYRSQVAVERRRVERCREIAIDAVAGLTIATGEDWSHLLGPGDHGDLDRVELRRRVEVSESRMSPRTR